MGTVYRLDPGPAGAASPTLASATSAFLDSLESPGTRRAYGGTLRALADQLGAATPVAALAYPTAGEQIAAWFIGRWGSAAPATFNRNLDALRSALGYWHDQGWLGDGLDPMRGLRRRRRAPDRTRALARGEIEALLGRGDLGLRERTLWRMLYETAARAGEVLALDITDLDLRNRKAKVRRKG
ncbi:MAG TPA: site-specific integrase, partial [Actinomycetota bacterium]|nr:site-specific integrase [Actinomycetota bacterium]